jgi:hypothetical protein
MQHFLGTLDCLAQGFTLILIWVSIDQKMSVKILVKILELFLVHQRIMTMFNLLKLRWIFCLKTVSDLNWKNVARPKTANSFWPADFVFLQLKQFFWSDICLIFKNVKLCKLKLYLPDTGSKRHCAKQSITFGSKYNYFFKATASSFSDDIWRNRP